MSVGSYMFNLVGSELVFMSMFVLGRGADWPTPPWEVLRWAGGLFMISAPLIFYPFAKLLFLAFDLSFRPARPEDFTARAYRYGIAVISPRPVVEHLVQAPVPLHDPHVVPRLHVGNPLGQQLRDPAAPPRVRQRTTRCAPAL